MGLPPTSILLLYSAPKARTKEPWMTFLPIGLGYIQAMLKSHGHACKLANLTNQPKKVIVEYLQEKKPSVVGLSMFTFNRKRCYELAKIIRETCPKVVILAGGPHPTHLASEVFEDCPQLDAIVCGEGEIPMLEIARRMSAGDNWKESPSLILRDGTRTHMAPPVADLDTLALPADYSNSLNCGHKGQPTGEALYFDADYFYDAAQLGYLSTSRGCPSACVFCGTPEFWGSKVRFRSPASVMREMKNLWHEYGLTYFNLRDDTFTANKSRVMDICSAIASSGIYPLWSCQSRANLIDEDKLVAMVRAGCEFIQFGLEHGSERMLGFLDKGVNLKQVYSALSTVRKVGMNLGIYLITGIQGETKEDVAKSEALIKKVLPHNVQISPLAVYPGTRLYSDLIASDALTHDFYRKKKDVEVFARSAPTKGLDDFTTEALNRLHQTAEKTRVRARYTPMDFKKQKSFLGWCATTNILCGEAAEDAGDIAEAVSQYSEIIKMEPQNPWGWLKRGLLRLHQENFQAASVDFLEVFKLTPKNNEVDAAIVRQLLDRPEF
ncbi:MAG: radical SAM protein [Holophagales bacterium]|jgi:radical SAM superfamily enzyme YgiQ (UPF0313 family)|nr:radical SAM protein [Holophagales bacterium]